MTIAILNYACSCCEIIKNAPDMETQADVEQWLNGHGYNLDDIYFMADCDVATYDAKDV